MLQNYFKIALRTLLRNKQNTTINVLGLAIGISACFTIFQIVKYEYSFDTFHPDKDRIYRICTQFEGDELDLMGSVCGPLPLAARKEATGFEYIAPIHFLYNTRVERLDSNNVRASFPKQDGVAFVTPDYFHVFTSYDWLAGSPDAALSQPNQVVLIASRVKHYFGTENVISAVGKSMMYLDSLPVTVTGVVADLEAPTNLVLKDFISLESAKNTWLHKQLHLDQWNSFYSSSQAFIKKIAGVENDFLTDQFNEILLKNAPPEEEEYDEETSFFLQPLSDLHFNGELEMLDYRSTAAHLPTLYALMGIAGILLLIASINFINLATAQSLQRSKEIGVRKVLGSDRKSLIFQFLSETTLLTSLAAILAISFSQLSMYYFQEFLPDGLTFQIFQPNVLLFLVAIVAAVSLLSGFYPAFILSSFLPILALKNQSNRQQGKDNSAWIRKGLIVFQFSVSLVLIFGTLIIGQQMNYMLNKDLGFEKEAIINLHTSWKQPAAKKKLLKEELARLPEVEKLSLHSAPPTRNGYSSSMFQFDLNGEEQNHRIKRRIIDENYLDLYGIKLLAGREIQPSDTLREFLINEEVAKLMGFQQAKEAVGKMIKWGVGGSFPVVGVVENFHHQSLHTKVEPLLMNMQEQTYGLGMKLNSNDMPKTMKKIEAVWKEIYPESTFKPYFLDEKIAKLYEAEQRTAKLLRTATGIAIFISCIGLFGLVSFSVARRTREIGIRKVLGASVPSIVTLLSKDFIVLVLIAIAVGSPVAWYFAQNWLSDFAYRIDIQWWMFAITALAAVLLAFLTVSIQSMKVALANPVESLRNE